MKEIVGNLDARSLKLGIVVSRFNDLITDRLLQGAIDTFVRCGGDRANLTTVRVPGSFEIPFAAQQLAASGKVGAVVCLGALIRGETDHYDYLASAVSSGISRVALDHRLPVTFGIITAETSEQALNRSGIKHGNKGVEATTSAIEMAQVQRLLATD